MKTIYSVVLVLLCGTLATAQSKKAARRTELYPENSHLFIKLNLSSLLDPRTPSIQPGIEYRFNKKVSGELAVGLPVRWYDSSKQLNGTYNRYYKAKAELKFVVGRTASYIGPELTYVFQERSRYTHAYYNTAHRKIFYDYAEFRKYTWCAAFKGGTIGRLGPKLSLDVSVSIGFRVETMRINAIGQVVGTPRGKWLIYPDREGTEMRPHHAMGLKLMYTIF